MKELLIEAGDSAKAIARFIFGFCATMSIIVVMAVIIITGVDYVFGVIGAPRLGGGSLACIESAGDGAPDTEDMRFITRFRSPEGHVLMVWSGEPLTCAVNTDYTFEIVEAPR